MSNEINFGPEPIKITASNVVLLRSIPRLITEVLPPKISLSIVSRMKKPKEIVAGTNDSVFSDGTKRGKTIARMSI